MVEESYFAELQEADRFDPPTQQPAYWPIEFEVSNDIPDWLDRLIAGYAWYGITRHATMLEF